MLPFLLSHDDDVPPPSGRPLDQSEHATILLQSGVTGVSYLKEKWTEGEVLNLSPEEHNHVERKSGRLFNDRHNFLAELSTELSALLNSGGGYIVLGQNNDSSIDGLPPLQGR